LTGVIEVIDAHVRIARLNASCAGGRLTDGEWLFSAL
jgi:hypothetical protein